MKDKLIEYFKGDDLAASTWRNKYALEGEETPEDMHMRMAKEFYRVDRRYQIGEEQLSRLDVNYNSLLSSYGRRRQPLTESNIFLLFDKFKYIVPAGSIMTTLGSKKLSSLSNCFVIDSPKDSISGVMKQCNTQAQIMKYRGGVGYDISSLRPSGATVQNAAKTSTGAASFMDLFSMVTNTVAQNGRRGALMLTMHINHPDVEQFITMKQDLSKVTGANVSVKVTDDFMKAVENDEDYILRWPLNYETNASKWTSAPYNKLITFTDHSGDIIAYIKKVKAKELWDNLIKCAHNTAEPGLMFIDRIHDYSPDGVYDEYKAVSTNPCGEIPMGPYDSCKLMHLNLVSFVNNSTLDKDLLYEVSYELTRLSDNLVDLEIEHIDSILNKLNLEKDNSDERQIWLDIRKISTNLRRIGVGFTGLADAIAMMGISYGSEESLNIIEQMMSTIFKAQLDCEIDMAIQRGSFNNWDVNKEDVDHPWFKMLKVTYPSVYERMFKYGRRNISWSTVAPTGTVSLLTQTTSGIEPLFQPYYTRRRKCSSPNDRVDYIDNVGEKYTEFFVLHPMFKEWMMRRTDGTWFPEDLTKEQIDDMFKKSPWYGSTSADLNYKNRIKIQSIVQKYTTHAISSTLNLPKDVSVVEVNDIYFEAWKQGLKGVTVYRDGSRSGILVNDEKEDLFTEVSGIKRPKELPADYYEIIVKGTQFIVLVGLFNDRPYEIFVFKPKYPVNLKSHKGKIIKIKKGQYRFDSELIQIDNIENSTETAEQKAHTLLISMLLRHRAPLKFVIKTAKKVDDNISSFSSAMCRVLSKYINTEEAPTQACPECGGRLINEAGCEKCLDCGYSRCS